MKIFFKRYVYLLKIVGLLLIFSSCSLFSSKREIVQNNEEMVPRSQYDQLMERYKNLAKDSGREKVSSTSKKENISAKLGETVSLKNKKIEEALLESINQKVDVKGAKKESKLFNLAYRTYIKKDFNKALKMFQSLEKSNYSQVRVRSRFYIAEILFNQKEYDLAMQLYESIINEDAFTGFSLKCFERLVVCSKELGIEDKEIKYQSLLEGLLGKKV